MASTVRVPVNPVQYGASVTIPTVRKSIMIDALFFMRISKIHNLDGISFEYYCASLLKKNGFHGVKVTQASGDDGIDIIASKKHKKYGFQCKRYSGTVGNKAVQEAYSGKAIYGCDAAVVLTNSTFTKAAIDAAGKLGVELWDNDVLMKLVRRRHPSSYSVKKLRRKYEHKTHKAENKTHRRQKRKNRRLNKYAVLVIILLFAGIFVYFNYASLLNVISELRRYIV